MRYVLATGAFAAFLAVALGAFGAHALQGKLSPEMRAVYQTGVQYHLVHALGLILVALIPERMIPARRLRLVGALLTAGIVLFSGSLYLLALSGTRILGAVTPLGGLCFLAGWLVLTLSALKEEA